MKTRTQMLRFCIAGGIGVLLYCILFFGLPMLGVWYIAASSIAYVVNVISNFLFNRYWTFGGDSAQESFWRQALKYFGLTVIFLPSNAGILWLLVERAYWTKLEAQAVATTVLTIISFFFCRKIFAK